MPWKLSSVMEQRAAFISLARYRDLPFRQLCKQFGIHPSTGYKWLHRMEEIDSLGSLKDRSRKPRHSPEKTPEVLEQAIVRLRKRYPCWGARKLAKLLEQQTCQRPLPSERTINRILKRQGLLRTDSPLGKAYERFERAYPNALWQMDYKGEFLYDRKHYCHPLDILDDHSRFNLVLDAHDRLSIETTRNSLQRVFRQYGLPEQMLLDHGGLWYSTVAKNSWTNLTVWLMRLGIELLYSRVRHPQTLGKIERFHHTLKYDLIQRTAFESFQHIQPHFQRFRYEYNYLRPHDALDLQVPAARYHPSVLLFPEKLPALAYPEGAQVKKVNSWGALYYRNRHWFVSEALVHEDVMIQEKDSLTEIYYNKTLVRTFNLETLSTY